MIRPTSLSSDEYPVILMKIYSTAQIRAWDAYTIEREPIASVELMNRAAGAFADWLTQLYPDTERPVWIFAGTGNNGGDGVAVARLLHRRFYTAKVFVCDFGGKHSADFDAQLAALPPQRAVDLALLTSPDQFPLVPANVLVVDALFGSGLSRPLEGAWAELVARLNGLPNDVLAIDLPSGLFADRHTPYLATTTNRGDAEARSTSFSKNTPRLCGSAGQDPADNVVHATRSFSFETPKLAFFFPENAGRVGEWDFGSIGLRPEYARTTDTDFHVVTPADARALAKPRPRFSHKGTFGHALLLNGHFGSMGAAVLAAEACLRAGVGLLTVHTPRCGYGILQTRVPEALCSVDASDSRWTELPDLSRYSAIGAGCGIGQEAQTAHVLKRLLQTARVPLVLDADALNLLAKHPNWFSFLPENAVLTPHPKEFERLFGPSANDFERNALQRAKAREHRVFIVLKGACTAIACPDGSCWFNTTGNPGMATGGSGDVLTGLLAGLLAQGYTPQDACLLGVYLHGLAGDLAAAEKSQAGMVAGDLVNFMGKAWLEVEEV